MGAPSRNLLGYQIGGWRLTRVLGSGTHAIVYESENLLRPDEKVAFKVLHPDLSEAAEVRDRFLREALACQRVAHENVVRMYDVGVTPEGICYLTMERLEGRSLSAAISEGPMSPEQVLDMGLQLAAALSAVHRAHVIHRDLKPDNILLIPQTDGGAPGKLQVKLLDFGVAKLEDALSDIIRTQAGERVGTPACMAPEQCQAAPVDARADVYSLGVVLYYCLTGEYPFQAASVSEMYDAHLAQALPDHPRLGLHPRLADLIRHMLAKQPESRKASPQPVVTGRET